MQQTILVTGGAGYIGSACVQALKTAGHHVVVFDDLTTGKREKVPDGIELVVGDLTDEAALESLFSQHEFDAVIHCAAKKAVGESEECPEYYFKNNVAGTLNLLTAMATHAVPKIIFSSTAAVYAPAISVTAFTEASPIGPVSVYGQSKLMAEILIKEFVRTGKLSNYVIFRYFNVAGDAGLHYNEDAAQNVFPLIARALTNGSSFNQYGSDYETKDGSGVRDYIHVADLAEAHLLALSLSHSDTFNLGTGAGYSVTELIAAFEAAAGKKLLVIHSPRRAGDVAMVVADGRHARSSLGWEPTHTLKDMVESTVRVYGL